MFRTTKLFAAVVGASLCGAPVAYAQQTNAADGNSANNACLSAAAESQLRQRETALLGPDHAAAHAQARVHQCRVAKGLEQPVTPDPQLLAIASATPSSSIGSWSAPIAVPVAGIASVLLNNGKVLFWSYDSTQYLNPTSSNSGVAYVWDPVTKTGHSVAAPYNLWCGGQTILADGRVYSAGGNLRYPDPSAPTGQQGWEGALSDYTFNPNDETWTKQPDMSVGRWYPTVTQLADNTVVIASGFDQSGSQAITQAVELFTPSALINGVGSMAAVSIHDSTGLYPYQYLMPSGQMAQIGPDLSNTFLLTPGTWSWNGFPNMINYHYGLANGVIVADASGTTLRQTIMIAGGASLTSAISDNEWLDSTNPSTGWKQYPQWLQGRHNANTVILPDGTLFTVGGSPDTTNYGTNPSTGTLPYPIFESELYNKPAYDPTGQWVKMAPNTLRAAYHSTAILLPDATVLLSEDDEDYPSGAQHYVQIYTPPYLLKGGARPSINSAPSKVTVGQTFSITTSSTKIASVALIAPGATTHGNDMHQRFIKLHSSHGNTNKVNVSIPSSRALVPPGYYMIFVIDSNGVPSAARFVQVS